MRQRRSPHERSDMRGGGPGCRFAHPGHDADRSVIASQRVGAKRGPMTGSAKQSRIFPRRQPGLLRRISAQLLRNFVASSSQRRWRESRTTQCGRDLWMEISETVHKL